METGTVAPLKTFFSHPLWVSLIPLGILICLKPHLQLSFSSLGRSLCSEGGHGEGVGSRAPGKLGGKEEEAHGPMALCPWSLDSQSPQRAACGSTAWRTWTRRCSS